MKTRFLTITGLGVLLAFNSCAPVYKCGEEKPERPIAGSNRLLAVVKERDALCDMLDTKNEETAYFLRENQALKLTNDSIQAVSDAYKYKNDSLSGELSSLQTLHENLQKEHMGLSTDYSTAITEKLNQGHLYDERLKEQERRMALKEAEMNKQADLLDKNTALLEEKLALLSEREKQISELESEIAKRDSITNRMNQLLKDALLGFDSDDLKTEIKDGKVYILMSDKLMFASGRATVQTKGLEALGMLGNVLKANKDFQILVEGHTDNVPIKTSRYKDNWDLSVDRATEIVRLLQEKHGIDPLRLTASGRGEFLPRASNDTAAGKAQNRRTEIILSPNLEGLLEFIQE